MKYPALNPTRLLLGFAAPRRLAYLALAYCSLLMALAGLVLPLLPATPFILLSAWSAAKGSPRLHQWIWNQPRLANPLRIWREQGAISDRIKWISSAMLLSSGLLLLYLNIDVLWLAIVTLLLLTVALFIWSRPVPQYSRNLCNELK